jgi:aryl-alcohol dehydrogenase-like predicted oxidoreductase
VTKNLVLGTANFGNLYGVSASKTGEISVDKDMAKRILAKALELEIAEIDTASNYGPAEQWIAEFAVNDKFVINTKIPWTGIRDSQIYMEHLNRIRAIFSTQSTCNIAWHNWEYVIEDKQDYLELHQLLDPHADVKFGVTTYGSRNAIAAVQALVFQTVQIEYNILNQSALNAFLNARMGLAPSLYLRSIFLQGALSEKGISLVDTRRELNDFLDAAHLLAKEWQLPLEEIAIRAVLGRTSDCRLVVGVESDFQLEQIHAFVEKGSLPEELNRQILELDTNENPAVDPRTWHK